MKKIFLLATILLATVTFSQRMEKGRTQLNAGLFITGANPLYIGLDYGLSNEISVGGEFDIAFSEGRNYTVLNGHANLHLGSLLNASREWDFYVGPSYNLILNSNLKDNTFFAGQFGTRYFFSNKLGINLELGIRKGDHVPVKLGLTFNL